MLTFICASLHFVEDFVCAFAMYAFFKNDDPWYLSFLIYNFCAFALQMPIGTLLDLLLRLQEQAEKKKYRRPILFLFLGLLLTIAGALTSPVVLGIGNAFFHVGGGVATIQEDKAQRQSGQLLGIFVAPGAVGLFLGTTLGGQNQPWKGTTIGILLVIFLLSLLLCLKLYRLGKEQESRGYGKGEIYQVCTEKQGGLLIPTVLLLFLAVCIRSCAGFYTAMPWKSGFWIGLLCAVAAMGGKMAGGILAKNVGITKTVMISLLLSAFCFCFSDMSIPGMLAILFFNMTMPLTLYLTVVIFPDLPGFSFGLLTLALFIGYVPYWMGVSAPCSGKITGICAAVFTLILLIIAVKLIKAYRVLHESD